MTAPGSINLQLWLGSVVPEPAPAEITEKLQSVEITRSADKPGAFQLQFHADRTAGFDPDFALLSNGLLATWNRVILAVTINNATSILMDGFITHQELVHDRQFSASTLTVTGEDVSILMDRIEFSIEWPLMGDSVIALAVLAKYTMIGIVPEVIPTEADLIPIVVERVPQQNATDRAYLGQLAAPYGYRFVVTPGSEPMVNKAYWGPPLNIGSAQPALSMDVGPATNLEKISFQLDSLAPIQVYGMVQDADTEEQLPLVTVGSTRLPPLAANPALSPAGLLQRRNLFIDPRYGYLRAMVDAQGTTDASTDNVVVAQGEVDTLRYGWVIDVPGLIDVRGAGQSYDGRYRVESVTHRIARGSYRQAFSLAREGTGSTISSVGS